MSKNTFDNLKINHKKKSGKIWVDFYHSWLLLSWPKTILLFVIVFIIGNLLFGFSYWVLGPDALKNSDGSYLSCFFFSIQTLTTIGYGVMAPATTASNIIVSIEAATGVILMALMSGLFFGKFSQAKARLRFTEKMLIIKYHDKPTLTFRMANERNNRIIDAKIQLTLLKVDSSPEGMRMRRFVDLPLELSHAPLFSISLTAMHVLSSGELSDLSLEDMCKNDYEFFVSVVGTDSTFGQTIHATKVYRASDIIRNGNWADLMEVLPDGTKVVDFTDFDVIKS